MATLTLSKDWPRYLKWGLFAFMGALTALVLYTRALFLFDPSSPHWKHIAPFQWWLLPHAMFGIIALLLGPFQFSSRLRAANLPLHRIIGRTYVTCVLISAPIATYVGVSFEPAPLGIEQYAQGGLWFLCTLIAFFAIRKRNVALHKVWMVRSYAMTFIFVASRIDILPGMRMNLDQTTNLLWYLIVGAFFLPDLWNASTILFKRSAVRVATVIGLALVLCHGSALAATASIDVVSKAVAASQTLEPAAFDGLYASNAVFVDEGPYVGYGANAGHAWADEIHRRFKERGMTNFVVTPSPPTIAQEKDDTAYIVVPLKLDGKLGNGSHYHEDGAFTFTLARQSGEWKISSQVWTVIVKKITPP